MIETNLSLNIVEYFWFVVAFHVVFHHFTFIDSIFVFFFSVVRNIRNFVSRLWMLSCNFIQNYRSSESWALKNNEIIKMSSNSDAFASVKMERSIAMYLNKSISSEYYLCCCSHLILYCDTFKTIPMFRMWVECRF